MDQPVLKLKKEQHSKKHTQLRGIVDNTRAVEAFEKLQVNINLASIDKRIKVIQVTSSIQDEGKTTVAVNLANSYVQKGEKVLIVDLDLRRPKIHRNLGQTNENGLVDYVAGTCRKDQLVKPTKSGIDVVLSGPKTPYPVKILESELLRSLLEEAKANYDVIILDTPPVSAVVDPIVVSKYVDAVIFVIQAETTKKAVIKESIQMLENAQANVVGTVLTSVKDKYTKYGYKYRYYYSERED